MPRRLNEWVKMWSDNECFSFRQSHSYFFVFEFASFAVLLCFVHIFCGFYCGSVRRRIYIYPEKEIIYILSRISFDGAALKQSESCCFCVLQHSIYYNWAMCMCACVYFMPHRIDQNVQFMSIHSLPLRSRHNISVKYRFHAHPSLLQLACECEFVSVYKVNYDFHNCIL